MEVGGVDAGVFNPYVSGYSAYAPKGSFSELLLSNGIPDNLGFYIEAAPSGKKLLMADRRTTPLK